jgi:2-polyprenyl-3-methyl-5-hydroxy-6-metoxy-1,4-benzoquinol methylase
MSPTIEMVKLGHIDELCPDDLWVRSLEMNKIITAQIVESGQPGASSASCPLCSGGNLELFTVKHGMRIDECDACGFRFTNPPPTADQLRVFYNSAAKTIENIIFEATRAARLPIFDRRVELINRHVVGGTLLDVGGAIGIFVDALMRTHAPFKISVVDLNEDAVNKLRARHPNVEAHHQDVFDHRGQYDVVTLWDTIEHLRDINHTASHLFNLLNPGGYLFISTPNIDSFEHWVGQHRHPQIEPLSHLNYFSSKTLRLLLDRHGFVVLDCLTPNGSFDVAYVNRMLSDGNADLGKIGEFLRDKLQTSEVAEDFAKLISKHRLAGNVVMIAKRPMSEDAQKLTGQ